MSLTQFREYISDDVGFMDKYVQSLAQKSEYSENSNKIETNPYDGNIRFKSLQIPATKILVDVLGPSQNQYSPKYDRFMDILRPIIKFSGEIRPNLSNSELKSMSDCFKTLIFLEKDQNSCSFIDIFTICLNADPSFREYFLFVDRSLLDKLIASCHVVNYNNSATEDNHFASVLKLLSYLFCFTDPVTFKNSCFFDGLEYIMSEYCQKFVFFFFLSHTHPNRICFCFKE